MILLRFTLYGLALKEEIACFFQKNFQQELRVTKQVNERCEVYVILPKEALAESMQFLMTKWRMTKDAPEEYLLNNFRWEVYA